MKAFTPLMKLSIMTVSIALVAMLVISAAPIVMGGIDVENEEPIEVKVDSTGTILLITGRYVVESSIDQDISDLLIEAYLKSKDGSQTMSLIKIGPEKIVKGQKTVIELDESIPLAELAVFFVTDNMDNEEAGIKLPINIHLKGTYSNNLAGLDMNLVYEYEVSQTAQFKINTEETKTTPDGEISKASLTITNVDEMLKDLVPDDAAFNVTIGGKEINLAIDKDGDDLKLAIETGEESDSISDIVHSILDAVKEGSDEPITFNFSGGDPVTIIPSDVQPDDEQLAQLESVMGSIDMFLDKYADMMKSSGGA